MDEMPFQQLEQTERLVSSVLLSVSSKGDLWGRRGGVRRLEGVGCPGL